MGTHSNAFGADRFGAWRLSIPGLRRRKSGSQIGTPHGNRVGTESQSGWRRQDRFGRGGIEELEARTLLAGGLTNAQLSEPARVAILDGLRGLSDWTHALSATGEFAEPLALLEDAGTGNPLTLGGLMDVGDVIDQALTDPVLGFMEHEGTYFSDDIVDLLDALPQVTTVTGGLATTPANEFRFEVVLHSELAVDGFGINFGPNGTALGLVENQTLDGPITFAVEVTVAFGVDLNPELNGEQAFFVRDTAITLSADWRATAESIDIQVGFLETPSAILNGTSDADLYVTLANPIPDPLQNVTLSELNGYAVADVAEIDTLTNSLGATVTVPASLGSWTAAGTPTLTVTGSAFGTDPEITTNADFDELLHFNYVDSEQLLTGLNLFGTWLAGFEDSSVLDVAVPFAGGATVGGQILTSAEYFARIATLRDADGLPTFQSAQQFANTPGVDVDYDPVAHQLVFPISMLFAPHQAFQPIALEQGILSHLAANSLATLTSASAVEFDFGADLSAPDQEPEQQFSANHLEVRGSVLQDASGLDGTARYGIVGIDFANGTYSGTSAFRANIVDPVFGDSEATLGELMAGLGDPDSLLGSPLEKLGSSELVLNEVSIQDDLFDIPAGAALTEAVGDFAQSTVVNLVESGIGMLGNFSNVTQDLIVDSLTNGLESALKWVGPELDAITAIGVTAEDTITILTGDAIAAGFDAFEAATGAAARLQDVGDVFTHYVTDLASSAAAFVATTVVDTVNETLDVGLTAVTETTQRAIEYGLNIGELASATSEAFLTGVGEFAGSFDQVMADVSTTYDLDYEFDLSTPATPQAYLLTTSGVTTNVYVEEVSLTGHGSIGVLGVDFDQGSMVVAASRTASDPSAPATFTVGLDDSVPGGRQPIDQVDTAPTESSATGQMEFNFRVEIDGLDVGLFHFRMNNLNNQAGSTAFPVDPPDFPSLVAGTNLPTDASALSAGLHDLLGGVADAFDTNIFGLGFPLVGTALSGVANFIADLQAKLDAALDATVGVACDNIEDAIEAGLGLSESELVQDCTDPTDIHFTLDIHNVPISKTISVHSDFGLPALGASLDADLALNVFYNVHLTFGLSLADGVYIDTASEVFSAGVTLDLIENPVGPEFTGTLGFIKVDVESTSPSSTVFDLTFAIDLADPNNNGRLTVPELLSVVSDPGSLIDEANTGVTGDANLQLRATAQVVDFLPSIQADISVTWHFDGSDLRGSEPEVTMNVGLNLGTFFSQTLLPILEPLQAILGTDPGAIGLDDVLDVLTDDLPVISDLIGPTSITDVAASVLPPPFDLIPRSIDALGFVVDTLSLLVGAAEAQEGNSVVLDFGDLRFGTPETSGFDARDPNLVIDLSSQVFGAATGSELFDQFLSDTGRFGDLSLDIIHTEGAQLNFPILEHPLSMFEWLLGFGDAELITFKLPSVDGSIPFDLLVPIFLGILKAGIVGSIDIHAGLAGGFDTRGFSAFAQSGNLADIAQGFYISDRENADGTGPDVPELSIGGDLLAAVALDAVVVEAGVGGGVFAEVSADLIDHDGDGKIRGDELASDDGCLALNGSVGVELEAFVILFGFIRDDFPFVRQELGGFNSIVQCPRFGGGNETGDILAKLNAGTGRLNLLVGSRGHERTIEPHETAESFTVYQDGSEIVVAAFGVTQSFPAADVTSIFADAGIGDDSIIIASSVTLPAELIGGDGSDTLTGGDGPDTIDGGTEDDVLDGQGGADSITGGDDNDLIYGGDETGSGDTIDAGDGEDEIHGGDGDDVIETGDGLNIAYGDPGNDSITGGANDDALYGGDNDDVILGLGGEDVILGDSGRDDLSGGDNADLIDGGSGNDTVAGEAGADALYGGDDDDAIDGGGAADYIEGGLENDSITGGAGEDIIRGGDGNDTIKGNSGDDLLYGEAGDDEVYGQLGFDTIEGGPNNDDLFGGEDTDLIHGDDGADLIEGGESADELYGDSGNDTIHGNEGSPPGSDGTCDVEFDFDPDSIYGGSGGDIITGDCDADLIFGEEGADDIQGNDGSDSIDGGAGNDTVAGNVGFDTLQGGDDDDVIDGGTEDDSVRGGSGNDFIRGDAGEDLLFGDAGDDHIEGGTEADRIDGGANDDHLLGQEDADEIYGNVGNDVIEGNDDADKLRGNIGQDLIYGDDGPDDIAGGPDNDTIRGGEDNDTAHGGSGDDLILGHTGSDQLFGDDGDDELYGYLDDDLLTGGSGNDRAYGQGGKDVLVGDDGNDILEGGPGDDTASGGDGNDALYGDQGVDQLSGGPNDDFLYAGDGIGDVLNGDDGNDHIVGSDDGDEDPNFADTVFFGDVIDGGPGDDTIESLGGADIIKIGQGNDAVSDGTHTDQITGGVPLPGPSATLSLTTGPDVGGHWGELNGSASNGGLTQVGGFEQATFANDGGVYVAWVDWRNGSSEIYLAFHADGGSDWIPINGSASEGGISDDAEQSRRPAVVELQNGIDTFGNPRTELLVAWTKIDASGASTIEVARRDGAVWTRVANPGQTGVADDAHFVPYSDESALLGWLDSSSGNAHIQVAQYVFEPSCYVDFLPGSSDVTSQVRAGADVTTFDLAAVEFRAAVAAAYGPAGDHDIDVATAGSFNVLDENVLCPAVLNANVEVRRLGNSWGNIGTFTNGDAIEPTVGMRLLAERSQGPNEVQIETDLYVAWHEITDRSDEVIGMVRRQEFDGFTPPWEPLIPQFFGQSPLANADSVSATIGYAAKPEFATSESRVFLAWLDNGVHGGVFGDNDGGSSIHVMSALGASRTLREWLPSDASNGGISPTGDSVSVVSMTLAYEGISSSSPYVAWTDHSADAPANATTGPGPSQVMVRHDLDVPLYYVLVNQTGRTTVVTEGGATDTISVVLMSPPTSNVRVELSSSTQVDASSTSLIFTPANWFTPQLVTIAAIDDHAIEGLHTTVLAQTVISADPNYNAIELPDLAVQIRDNDLSITQVAPIVVTVGRKPAVAGYFLTTSGVTDTVAAGLISNYGLFVPSARGPGKPVRLQSVEYDPVTQVVTMRTAKSLSGNAFYRLTVSGVSNSGDVFTVFIGVGTDISYIDSTGDAVNLKLKRGGLLAVTLRAGSDGQQIGLFGTSSQSVLSGTVRRPRKGASDGKTSFGTMIVQSGHAFTSTLKNPPFSIGPLPQTAIDELLAASGGTLAGVLTS